MKRILLLFAGISITLMLNAQVSKTVNVTVGGLFSALNSTELSTVTNLIITGTIDARDFKTMRDNMPALTDIDISGVTIAAYSGTGGTYNYSYNYLENRIPDYAFLNNSSFISKTSLNSLLLPSSITSIGNYAFRGCSSLLSVTIPVLVTTIGEYAFQNCTSLTTVIFSTPSSVTTLGNSVFASCQSLTSIIIPQSVASIGGAAFYNCTGLTSINFSTPSSLTTISDYTFKSCSKLVSIDIPTSVTSLGEEAFRGCIGLTSVNFSTPSLVSSIGYDAFNGCNKLASLTIPGSVTTIQDNAFLNCTGLTELIFSTPSLLKTIGYSAFRNCTKLTSLTIPTSVTSIEEQAFGYCSGLNSINFSTPSSITTFGIGAFAYCTGLTSVIIPTSVTSIARSVFFGCSGLTSVTIPESVTSIGRDVFYNCSGLLSITTQNPVPVELSSSSNVFYGVNKVNCTLYVPYQAKVLYAASNQWMDFSNITEKPGFKLSENEFNLASEAESAASVITSDVTWTASSSQDWLSASPSSGNGNNTLTITATGNTSLEPRKANITISAPGVVSQKITITQAGAPKILDVTSGGLFSALTELEFSTITRLVITGTIDARDFKTMRDNMPMLESIDISQAAIVAYSGTEGTFASDFIYDGDAIPINAFYSSSKNTSKTSLKSVQMPQSVKAVMTNAFYGCSGIGSLVIPSSVVRIWNNAFSGCAGLTTVTFSEPASITMLDYQAFSYCTALNSLDLPNSLTSIGIEAFYYNIALTTVSLPASLNSIGTGAFSMCSALQTITAQKAIPVDITASPFVFYNVSKTNCILKVPYKSKTLYAAANQWNEFINISELPGFKLSLSAITLNAENGSNASITITSDVNWSASSNQAWLTVNPETGNTLNTVQFAAQENTSVATRLAEVTVSSSGVNSQTITIAQVGVPKTVNVTAGGLLSALTSLELSTITRLVVTGTIDARDFKTMSDYMPLLAELDISGANIAAYSGTEGTAGNYFVSYPINAIPNSAFFSQSYQAKKSLISIQLPLSITSIDEFAFYYCTGLTSVTIPSKVTSIGYASFLGCTGLTSVNFSLPSSLSVIGNSAFKTCTGLTSFTIPTSVTTINAYAFSECSALTSVTIPASVTTIEAVAFLGCSGLTSIIAENPVPVDLSSSVSVFAGVNITTCKLYVPYESKVLYAAANQWKDFLTITEMPFKFSVNQVVIAAGEGSTATVDISTGLSWSVSSNQVWLTISPLEGTGSGILTFTAQANPVANQRVALITVSAPGVESQVITVTQQPNDNNTAPVANAGPDQTVDAGSEVTLDGSGSVDADGNQLNYKWTAPEGTLLSSGTAIKPVFIAPAVLLNTTYTFTLVVNDGTDDSQPDEVTITVRKANKAPVANAGPDQTVNEGATVTLDGSASTDPDNDSITYKWTAPAGITLSSTTIQRPTFTAPEVNTNTNYTITLVVSDGIVESVADQVILTVTHINKAPVANAGPNQTVSSGTLVTLNGTASVDADGDQLSYQWTAPAGITLNSKIVANPGFMAPAVLYNTAYTFSLVVNDGSENSGPSFVSVFVTAPIVLNSEALILQTSGNGISSSQINQELSTVVLQLSNGANPAALSPVFQISEKAVISPANGSKQNFTSPVNYKITAENGVSSKTYSVSVKPLPDILVKDIQAGTANINPGDSLTVNWKVENISEINAVGGWVERISLIPVSGLKLTINPGFENRPDLAAGATINRSKKIKIPDLPRFSGDVNIEVEIIPLPALQEYPANKSNNTALSASRITIGNLLNLDIQTTSVLENTTSPVRCIITRSGDFSADLPVSLSVSLAGQVTIPATVTIPANQSSFIFNLNTINNLIIDGPRSLAITASAADYTNSEKTIAILDDEIPGLKAQLSKNSATEGETITLTVTRDLVTNSPLTVNLSTTKISQWTFPATLVIPANAASGSVTVSITDDNIPELTGDAVIFASSAGFTTAQVSAGIIDNDIPQVSLKLLADTISESAGAYATWGIIKRIKGDDIITVNLSSNQPDAIFFPASISLPKGVLEQKFNIGVVDNGAVDGYRKVTISGSVFISSCNCGTTPENGGVVNANLVIADNDGPSLSVSVNPISLPEGKLNAGILTISRNTSTTDQLVVAISHNNSSEADIQANATIPAGEKTVQVPIHTINDNMEDGSQMVTVQATAATFTTGFGYFFVTDQNKPDLEITDIVLNVDTVATNGGFEITGSAFNNGFATAPSGVKINFYLSKDKTIDIKDILLGEFVFPSPIAIRSATDFMSTVNIPNETGNFFVLAKINPAETITELIYFNNVSDAVPVNITPAYTAIAVAENNLYLPNTTIPIRGSAFGLNNAKVPNVDVDVYILSNGTRRELKVKTDNSGNYSVDFIPFPNETGHFTIGASFPKQNLSETQDLFDIPGIQRVSNSNIIWEMKLDEAITGKIAVRNTSQASLNNLVITAGKLPAGCQLVFDTISVLPGNETKEFSFTLKATELTSGRDYERIEFQIKSGEGITAGFPAWYYCQASQGQLKAYPEKLTTTVTKRKSRLYELAIYNNGAGETGKVTVGLPNVNWMKLISPDTITSIAPQDTAKIILAIEPGSDMPLNTPISGNLALNCTNGTGAKIPFSFEVVSDETGGLSVDVIDEYTYFTEAKPHVKNAHVVVRHPFNGTVVAEGFTAENGLFYVEKLPEGQYILTIEAEKHESYRNVITIDPGRINEQTIFLSFQAITYTWEVVPTQIEDRYEVQLVMKYETNVPVPVVITEMPDTMPKLINDETFQFMVTLTNKGLITAEDVQVNFPHDDAEYEFVTNFTKIDLLAQQSIQFPVVMKRKPALKSGNTLTCSEFSYSITIFGWKCGKDKKWSITSETFTYTERNCKIESPDPTPGLTIAINNGLNFSGIVPERINGNGIIPNTYIPNNYQTSSIGCDNCLLSIASSIIGCVPIGGDAWKIFKSDISIFNCIRGLADLDVSLKDIYSCGKILLKDVINLGPWGCVISLLSTAKTCYNDPFIFIKSASLSPQISAMPPILKQSLIDLSYYVNAREAIDSLSIEIMGNWDWKSKQSYNDFNSVIDSFLLNNRPFNAEDISFIEQKMDGTDITSNEIHYFTSRWNNSISAWSQGIFSPTIQFPDIINKSRIIQFSSSIDDVQNYARSRGFEDFVDMHNQSLATVNEQIEAGRNAVCSSVSISMKQKLVMTREAFEGTLTIFNGNTTTAMEEIKLNLEIRDENGAICNDLFQINTKALSILTGIDGNGTLGANQKGSATVLFIPERGAAPIAPKNYSFGGSFSYLDPFTNVTVTRQLFPVTLTVNPSPDLHLHYFMQRDILGDDPLTEDIEPIVPAELALMIQNNGFGTASKVSIAAVQPKIADNEKGLAIDFALIGSNLNGQPKQMGLINIDFGNIAPQKNAIGQWWFTSSLLGHFVSADAKVTHLDSYGNPNISLISGATVHELIRSVQAYTVSPDGINDFLVNEIQDSKELPDAIFLSDGGVIPVLPAPSNSITGSLGSGIGDIQVLVTPSAKGWNYLKFSDPGDGNYNLVSVTRTDGQNIPLSNVWQTHVTLPDGKEPVYENMIHLLDDFASGDAQGYTLRFEPKDKNPPEILQFENVPATAVTVPVNAIEVVFKRSIDPATFDYRDMTLKIQNGADVMDNSVTVSQIDTSRFRIDLSSKSATDGLYVLTVQTSEIQSLTGAKGLVGKQAAWTQNLNVPAVSEFIGLPAGNYGTSFDLMQLRFNLPVDPLTLTPEKLIWKKGDEVQTVNATITPMDTEGKLFQVSGLKNMMETDGNYSLTVDLPNITTNTGVPGLIHQTVSWGIDQTAPNLLEVIPASTGGFDGQHITSVKLKYNEPVKGIGLNSFELKKDGQIQPISQLRITKINDSEYLITEFRLLTYYEGSYEFVVKASGISDMAGNPVSESKNINWTVIRTKPAAISQLNISPDMGFSNSDGITATGNLTVSMLVNQADSRIELYQTDNVNPVLLGETFKNSEGVISMPVVLNYGGNMVIEAHCIDSYGNRTITKLPVFIDESNLTGNWKNSPAPNVSVQPSSIQVEFTDKLLNDSKISEYLTFRKDGVNIENHLLNVNKLSDKLYEVQGLDAAGNTAGSYNLALDLSKLQKYNSGRSGASVISVQWSNINVNKAPSANAGPDQTVDEGTLVTIDGTTSSDSEGNTLTYLWTAPSGITLSSTSAAKPTFTAPEVNSDTQYTFTLVVSDGSLSSAPVSVLVTVKQVNKAPSANAGSDQTVDEGTLVTLDGTTSSDPDGNTLTYLWTAPSGITLSSTSAAKPTFTAPEVNSDTQYNFTLVVSNGSLSSAPVSVLVTVKQVNKAPSANAGSDQTVDEGTLVTLDGTASSDPDGNMLTYLWTAPSGITLSSTSAAKPTFTAPEVNSDTQYNFTLVVSDGSLSSGPASVLVTVKQVNKAPSANAGPDQTVDEGTLVTLDGTASSDPDGNTLTYLWTAPSGITFSSTTEAKPTFTAPKVNSDTQYIFTLVVSDGSLSSAPVSMLVNVKQVNKAPSANAGPDQTVDEGALVTLDGTASSDPDGNTLTYLWTAPSGITLSSTSAAKPTFTAPEVNSDTQYTFTLVVSDGSLSSVSASVLVTVKQVNKVPSANAGSDQTVDEGTLVTLDGTASSDPDGNTLTYLWTAPAGITLNSTSAAKPTFTAPEVNSDTQYNFTLVVSDGISNSEPSTVKISILNVIKTTTELTSLNGIKIYPNPSNGVFNIDGLNANQQNVIEIYTIDGKLIKQKKSNSVTEMIDISNQISGIYLLLIDNKAFKIIKQ